MKQENALKAHIPKGFRSALLKELFHGLKRWVALAAVSAAAAIVTSYLTPILVSFAVDSVLGDLPPSLPSGLQSFGEWLVSLTPTRALWWVAGAIVAVNLLNALFSYLRGHSLAFLGEGFAKKLRDKLFAHLQNVPFSYYSGAQTGDLIQRCTTDVDMVLKGLHPEKITILDEKFDEIYLNRIHELSLAPESVAKYHDMKIVYSPMHGAGVRLVPASLKKFGFTNVIMVKEQSVVDGNFPTVESPNPEERKTMSMAIDLAAKEGADLVLATDPDSDRIGVALRNKKGEYVLLNGNQTLVLLMSYQLTRWAERGLLDGNQYVVKTIVTSQMANAVADHFGVKCYDCLTGFKYIAKIIRENEGKTKYIGGGEESFGYLGGDYVRDKDAVSACSLAAEAAAWARDTMGLTLYEWLQELYVKYGFYREGLVSVVRKGKEGAEQIQQMMVDFRSNPPKTILGSPVVKINDFQTLEATDVKTGVKTPIDQDRSNVLQWFTEDGTKVSVRPSGTEPKIKFYFGVKASLPSVADYDKVLAELDAKIEGIKQDLKLV